jgi:HEAT repeat protein
MEILGDRDLPPKVREHAAGALGQIGDRRAIPALMEALPEARLRRGVVVALGLLRAAEAAEPLAELAPRLNAAQWALEQVQQPEGVDAIVDDLERGQLRAIGQKVAALSPGEVEAVSEQLVGLVRDTLSRQELPPPWLITGLQYLAPSEAGPSLCRALELAAGPEGRFTRNRLLRAVGAVSPMEAIAPLADTICMVEDLSHRQLAAVCLEKIISRHGAPARAAVHSHGARIRAELERLESDLRDSPRIDPERPWHRYRGTPGWLAAGERAVAAIRRLLEEAEPASPSTS